MLFLRIILIVGVFCGICCGIHALGDKADSTLEGLMGIDSSPAEVVEEALSSQNIETHHKMMIVDNRENDEIRIRDFLVLVNLHDRHGSYRHYLGIKAPLKGVQVVVPLDSAKVGSDPKGIYIDAYLKKGVNAFQLVYRTEASKSQPADLTISDQTLVGLQVFHNTKGTRLTFPTGQQIFVNNYAPGTAGYEDTYFNKGEVITLKITPIAESPGFFTDLKKIVRRIALKIRITYYEITDSLQDG